MSKTGEISTSIKLRSQKATGHRISSPRQASDAEETKKAHAAVTLGVLTRSLLSKNLAGWEVMEVFAGGVSGSDTFFMVNAFILT